MAEIVYFSCAALSVACMILLFRNYLKGRNSLLLWSSLCFFFLALNNTFIFFDLVVFSEVEMHGALWRNILSSVAGTIMLFGLIWEVS